MELSKLLEQLRADRDTLNRVIGLLEGWQQGLVKMPDHSVPSKRRGRKFMHPAERQEVSARMKRYWARRRKQR
jgi:hypothetical protein